MNDPRLQSTHTLNFSSSCPEQRVNFKTGADLGLALGLLLWASEESSSSVGYREQVAFPHQPPNNPFSSWTTFLCSLRSWDTASPGSRCLLHGFTWQVREGTSVPTPTTYHVCTQTCFTLVKARAGIRVRQMRLSVLRTAKPSPALEGAQASKLSIMAAPPCSVPF